MAMPRNRVQVSCAHCGLVFEVSPSKLIDGRTGLPKKAKYCSDACYRTATANRVKVTCLNCGVEFEEKAAYFRIRGRKYCSVACRTAHAVAPSGPDHQYYRGGTSKKRNPHYHRGGKAWLTIRQQVLSECDGKCARCGSDDRVTVHHLIPYRYFALPEEANRLTNLMPLCKKCHTTEDTMILIFENEMQAAGESLTVDTFRGQFEAWLSRRQSAATVESVPNKPRRVFRPRTLWPVDEAVIDKVEEGLAMGLSLRQAALRAGTNHTTAKRRLAQRRAKG